MPDSLFGGGQVDGSGAPINVPITAIAPPWAKNMQPSLQPSMPGQLSGIARDLQAGGFAAKTPAGHKSLMNWLNQVYAPAQTYKMGAAPVKPKTPVKPPVVPVNPAGPSGYNYDRAGRR